jgi:cyanophycinase
MNTKLFVGNLSFNTTENDLQDAFAAHGTVTEANLMMDRATGRPRGFGFITRAVIDQHFIARKRYGRLISVIAEHSDLIGVAIDENTAVLVGPDETFEACGESAVLVLDPGQARVQILPSKKINIENMTLHLLTAGMRYSLKDRKVVH